MMDEMIDEIEAAIDCLKGDYMLAENIFEKYRIAIQILSFSTLQKIFIIALNQKTNRI